MRGKCKRRYLWLIDLCQQLPYLIKNRIISIASHKGNKTTRHQRQANILFVKDAPQAEGTRGMVLTFTAHVLGAPVFFLACRHPLPSLGNHISDVSFQHSLCLGDPSLKFKAYGGSTVPPLAQPAHLSSGTCCHLLDPDVHSSCPCILYTPWELLTLPDPIKPKPTLCLALSLEQLGHPLLYTDFSKILDFLFRKISLFIPTVQTVQKRHFTSIYFVI